MGLRRQPHLSDCTCFFVTSVCKDHLSLMSSDRCKSIVAESLNFVRTKFSIHILGYVLMPNHFHLILYFPGKNCLSDTMRDLKKYTSFRIRQEIDQKNPDLFEQLRYVHREQLFKVWEDRFHDVWIGGRKVLETKLDYIHNNPLQVQWNLCQLPEQYRYSSAAFYWDDTCGEVRVTHYREFF